MLLKRAEFKMTVHQNSKKSTQVYIRSSEKVLNNLKDVALTNKYGKALNNLDAQESVSDVPRNAKQFYNHKGIIKKKNWKVMVL